MVGGTPVVFTAVSFEANASPGAGIIAAGLLENEFRIVSKSDPDSHMNRLTTDCVGCWAARGRALVFLHCLEGGFLRISHCSVSQLPLQIPRVR